MEIATAISGAMTAYQALKLAVDARDQSKLQQSMADMQQRLIEAMQAAMSATSEAMALQKSLLAAQDELENYKRKTKDREGYTLRKIPGEGKFYAYASEQSDGGKDEPHHYLCQGCYDKGQKFVLQVSGYYGGLNYSCPGCKTVLSV